MSIQLPLPSLTWLFVLVREDCQRSIQLLSIRPTLWVNFFRGGGILAPLEVMGPYSVLIAIGYLCDTHVATFKLKKNK